MRITAISALAALAMLGSACDGGNTLPDPELRGPEGGTLMFDAAMLARDGGHATRDSGVRDSGPIRDGGTIPIDASTGPLDGYPDVPRTHVGHADWNLLTLLKHNVVQSDTSGYEQTFLVVRNDHPTLTYCSIVFRVEFFDASGTSITWRTGGMDGDPRRLFSSDVSCIPPGTIGLGYGNASWQVPLDRVARIEYSFQGSGGVGTDVRTIATVVDEDREIIDPYGGGTFWAVRGRWRVLSGSVRSPDVTVFPIDARGLPFDDLGQIDLIDLYSGSTWPYTTTASETRFSSYLSARSYRGTSSFLAVDTPEARAVLEAREEHERVRQETDARRPPPSASPAL